MKNKKIIIVIIFIIILISISICGVLMFANREESVPIDDASQNDTNDGESVVEPNYRFEHISGDSVIEFDEGSEIYLDASIVEYLSRIELGVPAMNEDGNYYIDADGDIVYDLSTEKHLEGVLDNLITIINYFAKEGYSIDASHQIQRFYVSYYDRFIGMSYDELISGIIKCFPKDGADPKNLSDTILNVFGFNSGDEFAFVFEPMRIAEIKVEFYNVYIPDVELSIKEEALCIYDNWHNYEDDGYERNLQNWLHNVIRVTADAALDEESIIVAQILYAGSLADAEYRVDWKDALIRCMTLENMIYDELKIAVEAEFGVCIDYNVPIMEYFEAKSREGA